jgi:ubiquinone/menaquinone biosynthesis C-methylase UbiE
MSEPATEQEKQLEVQRFWDAKPCDSDTSDEEKYSAEYFQDIESERYRLQWHIKDLLLAQDLKGRKVLEIGTGVGTDARTIISQGGDYTGINVDAGSTEMTRRALQTFGLRGDVKQASAVDIPYASETFDLVYSFGVLHHIPQVDKAIKEIYRVLRPGGKLVIMLYNEPSINYVIEIKRLRKWGLKLIGIPGMVSLLAKMGLPREKLQRHSDLYKQVGKMSDEEWLSRNTDGPDNPYSRVYNEADTRNLLADFDIVKQDVRFFDYRHWGPIGKLIPPGLRRALGSKWGWHRIAEARKLPR